jgi:hypothetical protein
VLQLLLGGILPGLLCVVMLMLMTAWLAKRRNYPRAERWSTRAELWRDMKPADTLDELRRERLTGGEISFRKAYPGTIIERIDVDDELIKISGRKDVLAQAIIANGGPTPGVRSFVRRWCPLRESNPPYQIENLVS